MGTWAAITGALMAGFCMGVLCMSLLYIAKREDAEAQSFASTAHPATMAKQRDRMSQHDVNEPWAGCPWILRFGQRRESSRESP